jgi:hypothetical protein
VSAYVPGGVKKYHLFQFSSGRGLQLSGERREMVCDKLNSGLRKASLSSFLEPVHTLLGKGNFADVSKVKALEKGLSWVTQVGTISRALTRGRQEVGQYSGGSMPYGVIQGVGPNRGRQMASRS